MRSSLLAGAAAAVAAAVAATVLLLPSAPPPTYYVNAQTGSDAGPGTQAAPWRTLAKANAAATAGVTVVLSGTFTRQVLYPAGSGTATAPVTYKAGAGGATLDQPGLVGSTPYEVFLGARSYVTVQGLTIENTNYVAAPVANKGVVLRGASHDTFTGCAFKWMQVQLVASSFNTLSGNTWNQFVSQYVNGQPQTAGDMLNLVNGSHDNVISGNTMSYAGHSLIEVGNGFGGTEANNTISGNTLSNPWYKDLILADDGSGTVVSGNTIADANSKPALYSTVPGQVGQLQTSSAAVQLSGSNYVLRGNVVSGAVCAYGCVSLGARWYSDATHPWTLVQSLGNQIDGNTFTGNQGAASISFVVFYSAADATASRALPDLKNNAIRNNTFAGNGPTPYSAIPGYSTVLYHSAVAAPAWHGLNRNTFSTNTIEAPTNAYTADVTYAGHSSRVVQTLAQFEAGDPIDVFGNAHG